MEIGKTLFSDKSPLNSNIILLENNKIVTDNTNCAEILNTFFIESVENLGIDRNMHVKKGSVSEDPINCIIEKFRDHPSISRIVQKQFTPNSFAFQYVSEDNVMKAIKSLNSSKAYQKGNIPPKILRTMLISLLK